MAIRFNLALAGLAATALLSGMVACGDDDPVAGTGGSGATSATGGADACGEPTEACTAGCDGLWTCTQEDDMAGNNLCPGLNGAAAEVEAEFKCACTANALCAGSAALVDTSNCAVTIATIKGLDDDFSDACSGGGTGGSGGTPSTGGSGGTPSTGGSGGTGG